MINGGFADERLLTRLSGTLPSNLRERRRLAGVSPFIPATAGKMPALPGYGVPSAREVRGSLSSIQNGGEGWGEEVPRATATRQ